MDSSAALILPVENQVRELDPKLLLACIAAERGWEVVIGSRTRVDFAIADLPRGIYLSKSMTRRSVRMFEILRSLGNEIAAWDEEGLVRFSPEHYYARRLSAPALAELGLLFAWGAENAELLRKHPACSAPVHAVGNPRGDLLRPELRSYFDDEVDALRARYGRFVLINTNFGYVNAYLSTMNLLQPAAPGEVPEVGAPGVGLEREFVEGLAAHKQALYDHFRRLLPILARACPDLPVIVRPHPGEDRESWIAATQGLDNVQVVHEGNVIPWLLAARAVIHNGCTTGLEAHALGRPVAAFRPVQSERFDLTLPNALSDECDDADAICRWLGDTLAGETPAPDTAERRALLAQHLEARNGPLACERILDVLEDSAAGRGDLAAPPWGTRLRGSFSARWRSFVKRNVRARQAGHRNDPGFQRHRYQGTSEADLRERIARLGQTLGRFGGVRVETVTGDVFRVRT